ncbi:MAG: ribosomal RNA small subunit methyltransferase A [Firmicutes bacterium]|nr:ribosomal RNA small subunit methyltransferase A [Bacillota bacterium]
MVELPDLTSFRSLRRYLEENKLQPRRSMGQNFLVDRNIAVKIIDAAGLKEGEPVVEIGPGAGALTAVLARRSLPVVAVELDRGLAAALKKLLRSRPNVSVLQEDALKINWNTLLKRHFPPGSGATLISNLPYNISTPLLYSLYKQGFPFKKAILTFQKEVALRLTAEPGGNYGALTVLSRYYAQLEILFPISRSSFWPQPEVDSAVVAITPRRRRELGADEEAFFWRIVQAAFQQRRKMIVNSLRPLGFGSRSELVSFLRSAGIDPADRAEALSAAQFAKIARIAYNRTSKTS